MFKALIRVLVILAIVGILIFIFAPRLFNTAANSLISPTDGSSVQAQGLAQYFPASVTSKGKAGDLQVNLSGLTPSTSYEITLDQNQCGTTTQDLGAITSDSNGSFYSEMPLNSFDPNATWFVDIHQQGINGPSVACGQLSTNLNSSAQAIDSSQTGPNVFGGSQPLPNNQSNNANTTGANSGLNNGSSSTPSGLPNTGANPGNGQQYASNHSPRKY